MGPLTDAEDSNAEEFQVNEFLYEHSDAEESHSSMEDDWDPDYDYNLSYSDGSFDTDADILITLDEAAKDPLSEMVRTD
jgi:hypothetical protein